MLAGCGLDAKTLFSIAITGYWLFWDNLSQWSSWLSIGVAFPTDISVHDWTTSQYPTWTGKMHKMQFYLGQCLIYRHQKIHELTLNDILNIIVTACQEWFCKWNYVTMSDIIKSWLDVQIAKLWRYCKFFPVRILLSSVAHICFRMPMWFLVLCSFDSQIQSYAESLSTLSSLFLHWS